MSLPGGYDPLLGLTSPYPVTRQPSRSSLPVDTDNLNGVFLQNLAEQLQRSESPYVLEGGSQQDLAETLSSLPLEKLREIDQVSREFESVLLFTMFKQMWETVPESALFGSNLSSEIYREMWLEEISRDISSTGNGIGIADSFKWEMINRELTSLAPDSQLDTLS